MKLKLAKRAQNIDDTIVKTLKLSQQPGIISLAGGLPHADLFPVEKIREIIASIDKSELQKSLQYSETVGLLALRDLLARTLSAEWAINLTASNILITTGSQQGIDLIGKAFLDEKDTAIVERPTYLAAISAFKQYGAHFEELSEQHEIDPTLLNKAKITYVIPTFQNPTGKTWTELEREEWITTVSNKQLLIVEDNPYSELRFSKEKTRPLYCSLPKQTIYLGTCSKSLAPGLRVGFVVAKPEIITVLASMKQSSDLHTSTMSQMLAYTLMSDVEWYNHHLDTIREHYKQKAAVMNELLKKYLSNKATWQQPKGGMFYWLETQTNMTELLEIAVQKGIAYMPGSAFFANDTNHNTARLSFATVSDADMEKGITILSELL